ncbi:MAG TPA: hypothetical protein PLL53_04655 [Saprospiraceae bacterium]|jgi:hypothetical protein|nr:hypothetical protein [Saprospiraceae bacterium]
MNFKMILLALAFLTGLSACGTNQAQEAEQQKLWDEMMVVHDEVMPKMSDINALSKQMEAATADTALTDELRDATRKALYDLQAADKAMWDWMYGLQQLPDLRNGKKHEDIMQYLQDEIGKITEVKNAMLGSIEAAEALKKQLPQNASETNAQ